MTGSERRRRSLSWIRHRVPLDREYVLSWGSAADGGLYGVPWAHGETYDGWLLWMDGQSAVKMNARPALTLQSPGRLDMLNPGLMDI